jgi:hypothetical protein
VVVDGVVGGWRGIYVLGGVICFTDGWLECCQQWNGSHCLCDEIVVAGDTTQKTSLSVYSWRAELCEGGWLDCVMDNSLMFTLGELIVGRKLI